MIQERQLGVLTQSELSDVWKRSRRDLAGALKGTVLDSYIELNVYSSNAGNHELLPLAVVLPRDEGDVVATVQFCRKNGIPLTVRGAGTSVNDCALGTGIILDIGRHMNSLKGIDEASGTVHVEAGITLESLNSPIMNRGLFFPLLPVTGENCTVGGCAAIDAGGFLSSRYGRMHDLLVAVRGVDGQGNIVQLEGADGSKVHSKFRGTFGYRGNELLAGLPSGFAGSEGSLIVMTEAKLRVVKTPSHLYPVLLYFRDEREALVYSKKLRSPAVCEFLDRRVTSYFCSSLGLEPIEGSCSLLVAAEEALPAVSERQDIQLDLISTLRRLVNTLHLMRRVSAKGRYVIGAEGIEVPDDAMSRIYDELDLLSSRYSMNFICFGHSYEGILYIRPYVDLRSEDGRERYSHFTEELFSWTVNNGGALSSENGIGLQLAPTLRRLQIEGEWKALKETFDPSFILVPSRYLAEMAHLKGGPEAERKWVRPSLNWSMPDLNARFKLPTNSFREEMENCHGCAQCRTLQHSFSRCPVFNATGSELTSPRGLNNMIRRMNTNGGIPASSIYSSDFRRAIFDFCIQCKLCTLECPTHVNTPKLIIEARAQYVRRVGVAAVKRASSFFSDYELYTRVASSIAGLSNRLTRSRNVRALLEHAFGVDRRVPIPQLDREPFAEWFRRHEFHPQGEMRGEVAYFADVYAGYFNSLVGQAVTLLLESKGYRVHFPRQRFTGLPMIYYGMMREARKYVLENVSYLYPYAVKNIPIVCSSPSATMALRYDYLSVLDDERSRTVAKSVLDAHELLADIGLSLTNKGERIAYFPCCHSRALRVDRSAEKLLSQVGNVQRIDAGCCGAGGSYSFAKETRSFSLEIGKGVFSEILRASKDGHTVLTDGEECALHIGAATGIDIGLTLPYLLSKFREEEH